MESIISNEATRHERIMTPKSNLLINSWFYLGQLFVQLDRLDEATKCIAEIRAIASGSQAKIFYLRGLIAEKQGDRELSIRLCLESLSINVLNWSALETLTRLYYTSGQLAKAEKCAREALGNYILLWINLYTLFSSEAKLKRSLESAGPYSRSIGRGLIGLFYASRRSFPVSALTRL